MTLRDTDLDAATRKRFGLDKLTETPGRRTRRNTHKGEADAAECHGTCTCGETFTSYTKWERHADRSEGRHQWRVDLGAIGG